MEWTQTAWNQPQSRSSSPQVGRVNVWNPVVHRSSSTFHCVSGYHLERIRILHNRVKTACLAICWSQNCQTNQHRSQIFLVSVYPWECPVWGVLELDLRLKIGYIWSGNFVFRQATGQTAINKFIKKWQVVKRPGLFSYRLKWGFHEGQSKSLRPLF